MCGRYSLAGPTPGQLRQRFPLGESVEVRRRFNVAPTDEVLTVTTDREGAPRGDLLRWGLVPHWAKDPRQGAKMINARAETVTERPAYRDAFRRRRCLVLADGFYEWRRAGGRRQPHWITRADGAPFAFAGLWATWGDADAERLRTCTILTTVPSEAVAPLHDRMPVILPDAAAEAAWLDPATHPEALRELCAPLAEVTAREVSEAVNDVRCDGPECLEPPRTASLF